MKNAPLYKHLISALIAALLASMLAGCVKEASTDEDILNDAGTHSGAAVVIDPDEES